MIFLGIDAGTQGVRTIGVDEKGNVRAAASVAYETLNTSDKAGYYEQIPDDWYEAAGDTVRDCLEQLKQAGLSTDEVQAVCVDGTSGTIVPVDEQLKPLSPALMYNDARAADQLPLIHAVCGTLERRCGYTINASFALPRLLWIKEHRPAVYEKTRWFLHQADWLMAQLCGVSGVTDYSNALKTGYDIVNGGWPDEIGRLGIDMGKLPRVVAPGVLIGRVTQEAALRTGLSCGTAVVAGATDGYASALAAGAVKTGDWASILGTTLVLKGVTRQLLIDPGGSGYSHLMPTGEYMIGGASNVGGRILNEFKEHFETFNKHVNALSPTGVVCYPLMGKGERFPFVDPAARMFVYGDISDPRVRYTALMEGVGYTERLAYERMAQMGAPVGDVIYTSGGACRSEEWLLVRASILGKTLRVPAVIDAAMGSALLAAAHVFGSLAEAAQSMLRIAKTVEPVAQKVGQYEESYGAFCVECAKRYTQGGQA